jgi:hypothetical protein
MKKSQFEETTTELSIIITLLAFEFNYNWLGYIFMFKSIFDFICAIKYAIKELKEDGKI